MKQFLKNIGAMLYVFVIYRFAFALVDMLCGLLSALPTIWLVVIGLVCGGLLFGLLAGLSGSFALPARKWTKGTISGKIMCTASSLLATICSIFEAVKMVKEYNTMNIEGHTQYLVMTIIAVLIFTFGVIAGTIAIWSEQK